MKNKILIINITLIIMLLSKMSYSGYSNNLTLDKALELAYDNNPRMIEVRQSIVSAKGEKISAMALADPEVEFEIGGLKKEEGEERHINLDKFKIKQDFDPLGVYWIRNRIAKNDILVQEEALKDVWGVVYSEVREAYNKLILDNKRSELAQENLNILRQFFSKVQLRFKSGRALKNDVQRAKIEMLKSETEYLLVEKEVKEDKAKLNLLMGRPIEKVISIEEELEVEKLNLNLKELREMALKET